MKPEGELFPQPLNQFVITARWVSGKGWSCAIGFRPLGATIRDCDLESYDGLSGSELLDVIDVVLGSRL